jgi:hypothetical protein
MLPGILAHMLVRLDRMTERSRDEEDLYQALIEVTRRLQFTTLPSRTAMRKESTASSPGVATGKEPHPFVSRLTGIYTFLDDEPISLGPGVTKCSKSDCPLKRVA